MEVPRLGVVELELQLLAYTTAIAMQDLSHICDLHHSSWQCWILNLLSHEGTPLSLFLNHVPPLFFFFLLKLIW